MLPISYVGSLSPVGPGAQWPDLYHKNRDIKGLECILVILPYPAWAVIVVEMPTFYAVVSLYNGRGMNLT